MFVKISGTVFNLCISNTGIIDGASIYCSFYDPSLLCHNENDVCNPPNAFKINSHICNLPCPFPTLYIN